MAPRLIHKKSSLVLAQNVITVSRFFTRMKGLLGKKDFPLSDTLWILPCPGGIHTFFMKFPIDVIFVNRSLQITSLFKNTAPWKTVHPALFSKTHSVFEFKTPALNHYHLQEGDQLHVGH